MTRSALVDIECILHHETFVGSDDHGAVKVSLDGEPGKAVWIPKKACEIERKSGRVVVLTLGELLATERGLC